MSNAKAEEEFLLHNDFPLKLRQRLDCVRFSAAFSRGSVPTAEGKAPVKPDTLQTLRVV